MPSSPAETEGMSEAARVDALCLPCGYRRQLSAVDANTEGTGNRYWGTSARQAFNASDSQWQVYRHACGLARSMRQPVVWDIGCGTGLKLKRLVNRVQGSSGYGFDQPFAVQLASRVPQPGVGFRSVDLASFAPGDAPPADLVICADVLEHLEDPAALLRGIRRHVKPGCTVVVSTPDRDRLHGRGARQPTNQMHVQEWTMREMGRLLAACGFEIRGEWMVPPVRLRLRPKNLLVLGGLVLSRGTVRTTAMFELMSP